MLPPPIPPVSLVFAVSVALFLGGLAAGYGLTGEPEGYYSDFLRVTFAGAMGGALGLFILGLLLIP